MLFRSTELINQARAGLCQIATGSYVGNGQFTLSLNLGFRPRKIFFSRNYVISDPYARYQYVNGVQQNWSGFTGTIVEGLTSYVSSISNIKSYSFEVSDIFIAYLVPGDKRTIYKITLSYNNGIATFEQDCYFSTINSSDTPSKQNIDYSMNASGIEYNYLAIG